MFKWSQSVLRMLPLVYCIQVAIRVMKELAMIWLFSLMAFIFNQLRDRNLRFSWQLEIHWYIYACMHACRRGHYYQKDIYQFRFRKSGCYTSGTFLYLLTICFVVVFGIVVVCLSNIHRRYTACCIYILVMFSKWWHWMHCLTNARCQHVKEYIWNNKMTKRKQQ